MRGRLRRAIVAAALLAVTACGDEKPPASAEAAASSTRTPAPARERKRAAEATDAPNAAEQAPVEEPVAAAVAEKPTHAPRKDGIELTGSVVWADTGEPVESFAFSLLKPGDDARPVVRVAGTKGRFRAVLPEEGTWNASALAADGESRPEFDEDVDVAAGVEAVLRVERPGDAVLRIVDDATGAPLAGARVYIAEHGPDDPFFDVGHAVPGRTTLASPPLLADTNGRVALGRGTSTVSVFVIADGHAWSSLQAAFGATREVRLVPGGSLRLMIRRWMDLDSATVDTDDGSPGRVQLPPPDQAGNLVVEGLLPCRHTITVRRGKWFERGTVYAVGHVEVVAGAEARLTLDADPGEQRTKVAVTGSVTVPAAWREAPRSVSIEGAEPANAEVSVYAHLNERSAGAAMTFRFDELPEGRYRLVIDPLQWRKDVVAGPGATEWTFDLGPPAEVVVKVVDDATGAPSPAAGLSWNTFGDHGGSSEQASRRASDGSFVLQAQPGSVELEASAPGRVPVSQDVDVAAGTNVTVTLRLKSAAALVVRLECDGKPFTSATPSVGVRQSTGELSWTTHYQRAQGATAQWDSLQPGECTVSLPPEEIEGWTCAERTVELKAGETTTVVLEVKKKP